MARSCLPSAFLVFNKLDRAKLVECFSHNLLSRLLLDRDSIGMAHATSITNEIDQKPFSLSYESELPDESFGR